MLALLAIASCAGPPLAPGSALRYEQAELTQYLPQTPPDASVLAPAMPDRQDVLRRATALLGVPYAWGGYSEDGLDCSGYISIVWATERRHTTDSFPYVSTLIAKSELLPGDILNLETWEHPTRAGHARIFAAWASKEHNKIWVFESRYPDGVVYHVVSYDNRYTALRYDPLLDSRGTATLILPNRKN